MRLRKTVYPARVPAFREESDPLYSHVLLDCFHSFCTDPGVFNLKSLLEKHRFDSTEAHPYNCCPDLCGVQHAAKSKTEENLRTASMNNLLIQSARRDSLLRQMSHDDGVHISIQQLWEHSRKWKSLPDPEWKHLKSCEDCTVIMWLCGLSSRIEDVRVMLRAE
jgi:hypothetical protein